MPAQHDMKAIEAVGAEHDEDVQAFLASLASDVAEATSVTAVQDDVGHVAGEMARSLNTEAVAEQPEDIRGLGVPTSGNFSDDDLSDDIEFEQRKPWMMWRHALLERRRESQRSSDAIESTCLHLEEDEWEDDPAAEERRAQRRAKAKLLRGHFKLLCMEQSSIVPAASELTNHESAEVPAIIRAYTVPTPSVGASEARGAGIPEDCTVRVVGDEESRESSLTSDNSVHLGRSSGRRSREDKKKTYRRSSSPARKKSRRVYDRNRKRSRTRSRSPRKRRGRSSSRRRSGHGERDRRRPRSSRTHQRDGRRRDRSSPSQSSDDDQRGRGDRRPLLNNLVGR